MSERNARRTIPVWIAAIFAAVLILAPCDEAQSSGVLEAPPGTILPVRLSKTISSEKSKPGETITGRIVQDVPLPGGRRIPKGTKVTGKIVAITSASTAGAELSFRFDTLEVGHTTLPLTSNLRAVAGYVDVEQAQIPVISSGEGEVYRWLPTVQIGGDNVFGRDGIVTKWNDPNDQVGRATENGVVGKVNARPGTDCRGALYGNNAAQALWVFSSDACGAYGLPHITVAHAGRDNPVGVIVLKTTAKKLTLPSGTGMLLRVEESEK